MTDDSRRRSQRSEPDAAVPPPGGRSVSPTHQNEVVDVSPFEIGNLFLRQRWRIVVPALCLAMLAGVLVVLSPRIYTTDASFLPGGSAERGQLSRLSGVAARFGVELPSDGGGAVSESPAFYADLLHSRRILLAAVQSPYSPATSADTFDWHRSEEARAESDGTTLIEFFEIQSADSLSRLSAAVSKLRDAVATSTDRETGVVDISVSLSDPVLAQQVTVRLLELVNDFNREKRQTRAAREVDFIQELLRQARGELRSAEDSLRDFLEHNRSFDNSPELRFEHARLERRVDLKQQVYNSLATSYEDARIERVRETPVITVIDRPELPVRSDPKRLKLWVVVGFAIGGAIGAFWGLSLEYLARFRDEDRDDYRQFLELRDDVMRDLRGLAGRVRSAIARISGRR